MRPATVVQPRWNIIARRTYYWPRPVRPFQWHTDIVALGEGWTKDPFGADIEGDRIYGRGSCDMKGGLAAAIIAAEAFIEICPDFAGAIEISGTADEEMSGFGGVAWLAEGYSGPNGVDHVIIPEPLNKDKICLGHRGVWWAEIETKGLSRMARCRFWAIVRCAIWERCLPRWRKSCSCPWYAADSHAGGAPPA